MNVSHKRRKLLIAMWGKCLFVHSVEISDSKNGALIVPQSVDTKEELPIAV